MVGDLGTFAGSGVRVLIPNQAAMFPEAWHLVVQRSIDSP